MTQQNAVKRKVARAKSTNNGSGTKPRTTPAISRNGNSLKLLKRFGYSNIHTLTDDESAFFFDAGMMIDADGAYHAYHSKGKPGLDFLANAGGPGNWWALVTDDGRPSGKAIIQSNNDPEFIFRPRVLKTESVIDAIRGAMLILKRLIFWFCLADSVSVQSLGIWLLLFARRTARLLSPFTATSDRSGKLERDLLLWQMR